MYVLVIGRAFPDQITGMMGIFEFEQAAALSNMGCKTVYAFCDTRSIKGLRKYSYLNTKKNNVNVYGYHLPIGGVPQVIFSMVKKWYFMKILNNILKHDGIPDIIHVHFPLINLTDDIWDLLKSLNRPIVVTEHWTKVQGKDIETFRLDLLKRIVNEAKDFICVGDPLKNSVIELTNTDKDIKVIPNMISPMFYYEEPDKKKKKSHFEFIAVGRLVEVKRFDYVINAFTKVFADNKDVYLTIVGGGHLFKKLKKQIQDLGMSENITILGFLSREDTARRIRNSDAYVSGSVLETFGVPFIEAMACGKPVIGIKNGPIDKYISDANGFLFQQDNLDDMVKAMKQVYKKRESYDGRIIANTANKLFSEEAVAKQLKKTFENFL
jgi:L-malate glycosyltransferase